MGVFSGRDVYSPKFLTAEITDGSNEKFFIPIKYPLGDYFIVEINSQTYVFKIDGTRVKTTKQKAAKHFRTIDYDISNYLPVSGLAKKVEELITKNHLPKVNRQQLKILKLLGETEKHDKKDEFENHDLNKLIEELSNHKDRFQPQIQELINYFAKMETEYIVTPVREIADFLDEELKATDPKYLGSVWNQLVKTDAVFKKVTNAPVTAKKSWVMIILIVGIIGAVGGLVYFANESGAFDDIMGLSGSIPGFGNQYSVENLQKNYPTGASVRAAVDSGKLDYDKLPKSVQQIYDSTPPPVTVPDPEVFGPPKS